MSPFTSSRSRTFHDSGDEMAGLSDKPTVLRLLGELEPRDWKRRALGSGSPQYKPNPPPDVTRSIATLETSEKQEVLYR
jgi:hypothetical protein